MTPDQLDSLFVIFGGLSVAVAVYIWASWRARVDGAKIDAALERERQKPRP